MPIDLQGHRGARGARPENTLPSFEYAMDVGVSTIETDLHLTCDGVPILFHDPAVTEAIAAPIAGAALPVERRIARLRLDEVRRFRVHRNPAPAQFPEQVAESTPLAEAFALARGMDVWSVPTLADFFAFARTYAAHSGKTTAQRERAGRVRFDLEFKRVPFEPGLMGDGFDGLNPGALERRVVAEIHRSGVLERTIVRSFDHRSLRAVKGLEPRLTTMVLIANTAPVSPAVLAKDAGAEIYGPDYHFVDEALVRQTQAEGIKIIPWTVNRPEDWECLVAWGVDGLTTDYPDRLALWLSERGMTWL